MNFLRFAIVILVLLLPLRVAIAEEGMTPLPSNLMAEGSPVSLEEAIKLVIKDGKKLLTAKTVIEDGKKIHIIKVLTADGHIQYIKIEADTGKILSANN